MKNDNRAAVVTGGGSGIGHSVATRLAGEGIRVLVVDIESERAQRTAAQVLGRGLVASHCGADVSRSEDVHKIVETCIAEFGQLDIWVNNAGVAMRPQPVDELDEATLDRLLAVNVRGVLLGCKHAARVMKDRQQGIIVNIASASAIRPQPFLSGYIATKGAVLALTKALALELGASGIRVVAICPAATDTPMLTESGFFERPGMTETEVRSAYTSAVPMGRLCTPEDVAGAVVYLVSDDAGMVTGSYLSLDGGRLL